MCKLLCSSQEIENALSFIGLFYACNFPANTLQARRVNNSNFCYLPNKLIPNLKMNTRQTANSKAINIFQSKNLYQSSVVQESRIFCKLRRLLKENIYQKKTVPELCINSSSFIWMKLQDRIHSSELAPAQSKKAEKYL